METERITFESFVREHQARVYATACYLTGDRATGEDIAQETFIVAWHKRDSMQKGSELAWLRGIAKRVAANKRRKARCEIVGVNCTELFAANPDPLQNVLSSEDRKLAEVALAQLAGRYREPLILYYGAEQSLEQIASTLQLKPDAVKKRLSRGRHLLKDQVSNAQRLLRTMKPGAGFTAAVLILWTRAGHANQLGTLSSTVTVSASKIVLACVAVSACVVVWGYAYREKPASSARAAGLFAKKVPAMATRKVSAAAPATKSLIQKLSALRAKQMRSTPSHPSAVSFGGLLPGENVVGSPLTRPIDLDVKDVEVRSLLRLLGQAMDSPVVLHGEPTIPLTLDVADTPAIEVLEIITEQIGGTYTDQPALRILPGGWVETAALGGDLMDQSFANASVAEVLQAISTHLHVPVYLATGVDVAPVTLSFSNVSAGDALEQLLVHTGLGYEENFQFDVWADSRVFPHASEAK